MFQPVLAKVQLLAQPSYGSLFKFHHNPSWEGGGDMCSNFWLNSFATEKLKELSSILNEYAGLDDEPNEKNTLALDNKNTLALDNKNTLENHINFHMKIMTAFESFAREDYEGFKTFFIRNAYEQDGEKYNKADEAIQSELETMLKILRSRVLTNSSGTRPTVTPFRKSELMEMINTSMETLVSFLEPFLDELITKLEKKLQSLVNMKQINDIKAWGSSMDSARKTINELRKNNKMPNFTNITLVMEEMLGTCKLAYPAIR